MCESAPESKTNIAGSSSTNERIKFRVPCPHFSEIHFRAKITTPMSKVMKSYSEQAGGIPVTYLRFIFDGERINGTDTPEN